MITIARDLSEKITSAATRPTNNSAKRPYYISGRVDCLVRAFHSKKYLLFYAEKYSLEDIS